MKSWTNGIEHQYIHRSISQEEVVGIVVNFLPLNEVEGQHNQQKSMAELPEYRQLSNGI
tara:strand:+ start:1763 stop:1939 length:177 start_codon:yes stop_codon:yes gene_type:complete